MEVSLTTTSHEHFACQITAVLASDQLVAVE